MRLSRRRRALFMMVVTLASLFLAEIVLRVFSLAPTGDYVTTVDPAGRFFDNDPGTDVVDDTFGGGHRWRVVINDDRMRREGNVPRSRGAGPRVICLGDSITFGWGVDQDEAYPQVLERLLARKRSNRPVEILNCGIAGTTIIEQRTIYEERWSGWDHDLVLLGVFENDVKDVARFDGLRAAVVASKARHAWFFKVRRFLGRFALFNGAKRVVQVLYARAELGIDPSPPRTAVDPPVAGPAAALDPPTESARGIASEALSTPEWIRYRDELRALRRAVQSRGAKLALVLCPGYSDLRAHDVRYEFVTPLRALAAGEGLPLLDPRPAFPRPATVLEDDFTLRPFGDDAHYNARGHALLAEGILEAFEPLLPPE